MSNEVFPRDVPGFKLETKRTQEYRTTIQEAISGTELRASWWSTPRRHWILQYEFLRQQGANGDELQPLLDFIDLHKGSWDSFLFNDPLDEQQYRVRFASDKVDFDRFFDKYWECKTLELVEVK